MLTNRLTSVNYVKKRLIQNIQRINSKKKDMELIYHLLINRGENCLSKSI